MKRSALLTLLVLLVVLPSCTSWFFEKPTFAFKEVSITRFSPADVNLLFGVEVKNPNSYDLNLLSVEYTISINDREVGKGKTDKEVKIGKVSSTLVQIPLQTDLGKLGDPLLLLFSGKELRYKIEGAALIKSTVGTVPYQFSHSDKFNLKR
jgi:LEA14-like dessication related protein